MTKRQFVVLVFRLFALYLAFNVITNIGYIFATLRDPFTSFISKVAAVGFDLAIVLLLLWLLWKKSEWLMEKVFAVRTLSDLDETPEHHTEEASPEDNTTIAEGEPYYDSPLSTESIQIIAISLVGLWAVFTRLPYFLRGLGSDFGAPIGPVFAWYSVAPWLPDAIVVALGLWLFLRPWQFQEWIERFKPKAASSDKDSD